jgi:PPK2 family polyphosphate:nucleotide phosphotransferase
MKISPDDFRVRPGKKVDLQSLPTSIEPLCKSKQEYATQLAKQTRELSELQNLLYAADQHALLLVFQAMDAAGKDSAIKHVMSGVNPQGCQVFSFKHPSPEELDHDFLWNATRRLPERGRIGIFNRSYYEEVLIVRVHPEILKSQNIPNGLIDNKGIWKRRFESIVNFEQHLHRNGTRILKFFLHLSKEEQRKRFLKRIDDPEKNWKFGSADIHERGYWDDYRHAYEQCLRHTSSKTAPWFVIPADEKASAQLLISRAIIDALKGLRMAYPQTSEDRRKELQGIRVQLESEA